MSEKEVTEVGVVRKTVEGVEREFKPWRVVRRFTETKQGIEAAVAFCHNAKHYEDHEAPVQPPFEWLNRQRINIGGPDTPVWKYEDYDCEVVLVTYALVPLCYHTVATVDGDGVTPFDTNRVCAVVEFLCETGESEPVVISTGGTRFFRDTKPE